MVKISDRVFFIKGEFNGKFPYCNVLIVDDVLIDSGAGQRIIEGLLGRVSTLILTHLHPDHASGAWMFNLARKRVLSPAGFKTDLDSISQRFMTKKLSELWKKVIAESIGMKSFKSEKYNEGIITQKPVEIEAIHAPGHTKDHHVFLIDQKIMYGADIDLTEFGPFYGNPEGDISEFEKSIKRILTYDIEIFVSSHFDPIFGKDEIERRITNYLSFFKKREEKLIDLLSEKPRTLQELVKLSPIYGGRKKFAKEILDFFEENMIQKHLDRLVKEGNVKRAGNLFKLIS